MLNIGYFQFAPKHKDIEYNLRVISERLNSVNSDLIALPELAFTGYSFSSKSELNKYAQEPDKSEIVNELVQLCKNNPKLNIVTGFAEKENDKIYNSSLLINENGLIDIYRKLHLFNNEKICFDEGNLPLKINTINNYKIGMMICFDWAFPEVVRTLMLKGTQIICHPSNLVLDYCQKTMITRSIENLVYIITANRTGSEESDGTTLTFTGKSQIVAPKGEILKLDNEKNENLFTIEVDPTLANNKYLTEKNNIIDDRRANFYYK